MILNWEQKWQKITQIAPRATVCMRLPGDWYVSAGMEHAQGEACLIGDYGDGFDPAQAIIDHWNQYADGRPFYVNGKWWVWGHDRFHPTVDPRTIDTPTPTLAKGD